MQQAMFGAGCFWGVEAAFRRIAGVSETAVGYAGGTLENPSYQDVCSGTTGHAEVVLVRFDESVVSYEELLAFFWQIHDPTTLNRQGPDVGSQYRSVIYYHDESQEQAARTSMQEQESSGRYHGPIVTELVAAPMFYMAENYHQKYFDKRGMRRGL